MLIQVIFEDSMDGALAALDSVHAEADAVEFRLDPMVDFGAIRQGRDTG